MVYNNNSLTRQACKSNIFQQLPSSAGLVPLSDMHSVIDAMAFDSGI